jgi:hypothetical protein
MNSYRSAEERVVVIAQLAYRLWQERGCPEGSPDCDWYNAELLIEREQGNQQGSEESLDIPRKHARQKMK